MYFTRKIIVFFIFTMLFSSCSLYHFENEPNDNISDLRFFYSLPARIKGNFKIPSDKDLYSFIINKDGFYSFSLSSIKGFDTSLSVLSTNGKLIVKSNDSYKNFGENIPSLFLNKGIYFVLVQLNNTKDGETFNKDNNYILSIKSYFPKLTAGSYSLEKEPNSSFSTIQSIFPTVPMVGFYAPSISSFPKSAGVNTFITYLNTITQKDFSPYDIDLYSFYYNKPGDFLLNLALSKVNDFDPLIAIFDVPFISSLLKNKNNINGSMLIQDDNSYDEGEDISNYVIKGKKQYIIALIAQNRLNYHSLAQAQNQYYQIKLDINNMSTGIENEPNDTIKTSNLMNTPIINGTLDSLQDKDVYIIKNTPSINKSQNAYASIKLTPNEKNNFIGFDIYNEKGEIIKTIDYTPKNNAAIIKNLFISPLNYYYVIVKFMSHSKMDDTSSFNKATYSLAVSYNSQTIPSKMELEPNDYDYFTSPLLQKANTLTQGLLLTGFINNKGDIDKYFFIAPNTGNYRIAINNIPNTNLLIRLYKENTVLIKTVKTKIPEKSFVISQKLEKDSSLKIVIAPTTSFVFEQVNPYNIMITPIISLTPTKQ